MRRKETGFTLVELMIVVAIIGILAAVAIPTFMNFMQKGKKVEAKLAIDKLMKNVRVYNAIKHDMPPSSSLMPSVSACANGGKTGPTKQSDWDADAGWQALEFHLDEPGYYQYRWIKASINDGTAIATADLDCDGILAQTIATANVVDGNVFETEILDFAED